MLIGVFECLILWLRYFRRMCSSSRTSWLEFSPSSVCSRSRIVIVDDGVSTWVKLVNWRV